MYCYGHHFSTSGNSHEIQTWSTLGLHHKILHKLRADSWSILGPNLKIMNKFPNLYSPVPLMQMYSYLYKLISMFFPMAKAWRLESVLEFSFQNCTFSSFFCRKISRSSFLNLQSPASIKDLRYFITSSKLKPKLKQNITGKSSDPPILSK